MLQNLKTNMNLFGQAAQQYDLSKESQENVFT